MGLLFGKKSRIGGEPEIIGVTGAGRGVGTTHFCVLAANYLCSVRGQRTAVLEWNDHGDFARFGSVCTGLSAEESRYRIQDVDFYPRAAAGTLAGCIHMGYQKILIDFGRLSARSGNELLRCHKVFVMVSFSEWQNEGFRKPGAWEESAQKNGWQCLASFGSEESRIRWNKRRVPAVRRLPFSADPFTVTEAETEFMKTIL